MILVNTRSGHPCVFRKGLEKAAALPEKGKENFPKHQKHLPGIQTSQFMERLPTLLILAPSMPSQTVQ